MKKTSPTVRAAAVLGALEGMTASQIQARQAATLKEKLRREDNKLERDAVALTKALMSEASDGRNTMSVTQIENIKAYSFRKMLRPTMSRDWSSLHEWLTGPLRLSRSVLMYKPVLRSDSDEGEYMLMLSNPVSMELGRKCHSAYISMDAVWDSNRYHAPLTTIVGKHKGVEFRFVCSN